MAKKIVRGITDVKTINNQDFDTNNVNDLLSDGQYNYIHRKKGKSEEYHNLTDNIKTISSDNTDLLAVTNNNKTNNTATLHPKHDAQKEQVLESTRNTISIHHGTNGTDEKTTVDLNPAMVLEHDNLQTTYGISKATSGNVTTLGVEYTKVEDGFDLNNFSNGLIRGTKFVNSPSDDTFFFVKAFSDGDNVIQEAMELSTDTDGDNAAQEAEKLYSKRNVKYIRSRTGGVGTPWTEWREQFSDWIILMSMLGNKQNTLSPNTSIGILGNNQLQQLFYYKETYTSEDGLLTTVSKDIATSSDEYPNFYQRFDEYSFTLKINQGQQSATFTLNEQDKTNFDKVITAYGVENSVRINGCLFTLSDFTLTVTTDANTENNLVITFSDII